MARVGFPPHFFCFGPFYNGIPFVQKINKKIRELQKCQKKHET